MSRHRTPARLLKCHAAPALLGHTTDRLDPAGVLLLGIGGATAQAGAVGFLPIVAGTPRRAPWPRAAPAPIRGEPPT